MTNEEILQARIDRLEKQVEARLCKIEKLSCTLAGQTGVTLDILKLLDDRLTILEKQMDRVITFTGIKR